MEFVTWPIKINLFDIINRHFTQIHGVSQKQSLAVFGYTTCDIITVHHDGILRFPSVDGLSRCKKSIQKAHVYFYSCH